MSAMVASSLNPEAPLFIPAAFQQVEDFSPQWWDLVKSTAWFRDHWYHQHQQLDDMADSLMALEAEDAIAVEASQPQPPAALKIDGVLKALSLASPSPKGGFSEKPRYTEKPTKYAGSPRSGGAPRFIHQPR
ncbi:protein EARLY RESPONSIVE TO DEHYDRATION 15-like [Triticum dicoccoides]|uniref:protein EARLY RESPONSIVE TO DEHYDRATION 15-like n=1 Tax=Triticum dicoccoides TaxID=85692 RepID=UPI000E7B3569|nr:protein EARLY RESPONSIVE TO DEHYDRATION 15-like [Triticum dicoccoides]XP_037487090.1 protein EARLY RESPONSIVE TO DEHYDRATION 15-like [Triticum dicoccoides]